MNNKTNSAEISPKKKRNIIIISSVAVALAVILVLSIVLPLVLRVKDEAIKWFTAPENTLPTEEVYALDKYAYDELSDVKVTMRADTMNVTKRNLERPTPELLSDDFSLVYDTDTKELKAVYGELVQSSGNIKAASISFDPDGYPSPSHGVSAGSAFASMYSDAIADAGVSADDYFYYYKYMLMTQGQHLSNEASQMSANGTLTQEWLKKHPAADAQYGAVLGENNAVEKEITLDPLYRSSHATGLYLPAGELVTVKVEGLGSGERVGMTIGLQNSIAWRGSVNDADFNAITGGLNQVTSAPSDAFFIKADVLTANGDFYKYNTAAGSQPFIQSQWKRQNARAPWVTGSFTFNGDGEYKIGNAFGGIMHINPSNCYSHVKITITGAVETPHYILGVTTPEYFEQYLKDAPGVVGVIDTENGQLIGPTGVMGTTAYLRRNDKTTIDKLAMLWHSFFSVNESFTGGTYNRPNVVKFDWHVPAGAAVALGGYVYACPTGWFNHATNYRGLLTGGQWGILHEIGHNHASSYGTFWGFGDGKEGEVHNNAMTTLAYIMFCDIGSTRDANGNISAEHGFVAHPYSSLRASINTMNKSYTDYSQNDYFEMLSMYSNIMHSFGAEKFYELLYTYKAKSAYLSNKRADFTYRCALMYGMDFRTYFNRYYKANLTDEQFLFNDGEVEQSREYLDLIEILPAYEPVASYYAGGIDGVKTGGDYLVAFGDYLTFDLKGKTISGLDTSESKGFDIIGVDQPEHGTITPLDDGKYRYGFNSSYTGTFDTFSYYVRMKDDDKLIHKFDVSLRISYNSARVSVYSGVNDPGVKGAALFENVKAAAAQIEPEYSTSTIAGVSSYNSSAIGQVRIADFLWKSPVSGEVAVAVYGSNAINMSVGESFDTLADTQLIFSGGLNAGSLNSDENCAKFKYILNVVEGNTYAFRVYSTNVCKIKVNGEARVAIFKKDGEIVAEESLTDERISELFVDGARYDNLPVNQIFHPNYDMSVSAAQFVYEPEFMVSKKDNIKLSTTGTDKSEWSVSAAPTNVNEGRFATTQMIDPDPESETYGQVIGTVEVDKWDYLIDGLTGTIFHTAWRGSDVRPPTDDAPDVFVIDTAREQPFNYFAVTTRHSQNDDARITKYRLSISSDNVNFTTVSEGSDENGTGLKYAVTNGTKVATLKFAQVTGRYWKLEAFKTSGKNFTIVSELDAGIQSQTQRVIAPTSSKLYADKHWYNSIEVVGEPSGYMIATKKRSKMVVKFAGDSFALYAATGEGYGKINIKIDGKSAAVVDLDSNTKESRKLVFNIEQLENKEHTVEIITQNSGKVMLNVIGIPYTAELLNAPNIYLEHNLTVALIVFVLLFAALLAFALCLTFIPKFRNLVFGNKVMKKYDDSVETKRAQKAAAKANDGNKKEKAEKKAKEPEKKPTPQEMVAQRLQAKKATESNGDVKPSAEQKRSVVSTGKAEAKATAKPETVAAKPAAKPTERAEKSEAKSEKQTPTARASSRGDAAARAAEIAKRTPVRPATKNAPPTRPTKK